MEISMGTHSCNCDGREFAHLEKYCQSDACFICQDGQWKSDNKISVL